MKKQYKKIIVSVAILGVFAFGAELTSDPVAEMERLQEAYFKENGTYLQIIPDNKLPSDRKGSVKSHLGKDAPAGMRVNVYGGKNGQGYQIIWEDANGEYAKANGFEAVERTYNKAKETATSTRQ